VLTEGVAQGIAKLNDFGLQKRCFPPSQRRQLNATRAFRPIRQSRTAVCRTWEITMWASRIRLAESPSACIPLKPDRRWNTQALAWVARLSGRRCDHIGHRTIGTR
jgi:hypothetical protein